MNNEKNTIIFEDYFHHLNQISFLGKVYKKYFLSPILLLCARQFGKRVIEVGSGIGSGVLGSFPNSVQGLEINPIAVEYCKSVGLNAQLINPDGTYPIADGEFDSCILDNVLEHIENPHITLNECYRITKKKGALIIVVPGISGFQLDSDHKNFYDEQNLIHLDNRWELIRLFSMPFFFLKKNYQYLLNNTV
jgi:SAM-dependent methyltransferase